MGRENSGRGVTPPRSVKATLLILAAPEHPGCAAPLPTNGPKTRNLAEVIALTGDRHARRPSALRFLPETINPRGNNCYEAARSRRSRINICVVLMDLFGKTSNCAPNEAVPKGI